ncbi:RagB/SusD family nutrient uptake outer membrane protein [Flammeovirga sp. EKP202]|uniref:RagB/SusD family nutrient uptake outer membrane protein n=1 Tax=Flammeovirga sp. EKP202 TaxID=2770592 RepID=UPI00165ED67F|nr:RagB/SusD family nutrient uptake outer membrane protein [Flammeovirga sp. EKP202]MBD0401679.1 RagB/SusD family nutrient uptake outer membrane protein [Flammeovirga sp. EKP202]
MKKLIKYITIALFAATSFSCDHYLDVSPPDAVAPDEISDSNYQFFLNGAFRQATPDRDQFFTADARGGNYDYTNLSGMNSTWGKLILGGTNIDDNLPTADGIWARQYKTVYNANVIINAFYNGMITDNETNRSIRAEALFLRALSYYNLMVNFSGVPLIRENTTENLPRNTEQEIIEAIIEDLEDAQESLNSFDGATHYVSVEAVKMLRMRIALWEGDHTTAHTLAEQVINSDLFQLDTDYGRIFRAVENSNEVIFAFSNRVEEQNTRFSQLFWPYGTDWSGSYFVRPSQDVIQNLFEEEDKRKEVNMQVIDNDTQDDIVSKYHSVQPIIIFRISEAILASAETASSTSEGLVRLNQIREIRGLSPLNASDIAGKEWVDVVLEERQREFYSEGMHLYDLIRTDKAINLPNIQNKNQYLLPIPASQRNLSQGVLEQNPGY